MNNPREDRKRQLINELKKIKEEETAEENNRRQNMANSASKISMLLSP